MNGLPMIGSKQRGDQSQWEEAWAQLCLAPNHALAEAMVARAAREVRATVRSKRAAFGWSGGKDSLALAIVAEAAGIDHSMIGLSAMEWPAFTSWLDDHSPAHLERVTVESIDYAWLRDHPAMLFPSTSADAGKWFAAVQHKAQRRYCADHDVEVFLLGRRRADGNFVGRGTNTYTDKGGFTRYSPLASWSHAELLNVLAAYAVPLPDLYFWPRGFIVGTGPWPSRRSTGSAETDWDECWRIDPQVVTEAAENRIPGAKEAVQRWT